MKFKNLSLRTGRPADALALATLRDALRIATTPSGHTVSHGGFLLGCTEDEYRMHASAGHVIVLECRGIVLGFAVVLPDGVLRASPLWARRDHIDWCPDLEPPIHIDVPTAYFDQLAVVPHLGARLGAPALALACAARTFRNHEQIFATVVESPVMNLAAVPLINRIGGIRVGTIVEAQPTIGDFLSGVYWLNRNRFNAAIDRIRAQGTSAERTILSFVETCG